MPLTFKRVFVTVSTLLLTPFVALLSIYSWIHFGGNFHEVVKHEIYRSGQLSSAEFRQKTQEFGLKSVLNLRGANQDATWYQEEVENAGRLGILHMDVSLSAGTALDTEQMEGLLQMIRKAPKPLLIHCTDGADRSGLLSALSLLDSGQTAGQAQQQLSLRYGHFPYLWWSYTQAMDQSLAQYIQTKP